MRRVAVLLACLLLTAPAYAASVDVLAGATSLNGEGSHGVLAVGLDVQVGDTMTWATRLSRMGLDDGYATGLTMAAEYPLAGVLYATGGAGLTWYNASESVDIACRKHHGRTSCSGKFDAPDASGLHLQGGMGATIPAGRVGIALEAVYRLPLHEGTGGVVGTVGVAIPLP